MLIIQQRDVVKKIHVCRVNGCVAGNDQHGVSALTLSAPAAWMCRAFSLYNYVIALYYIGRSCK